ncbi:MAG: DEAD/DEAH box helicase [Desulfotalea sp.]
MSFNKLGLSAPILQAVEKEGYTEPTPIQLEAIPAILEGRDVMAAAQTGTGKTAGFVLPIIEKLIQGPKPRANQARTLILTPTRELAAQVAANVESYSSMVKISSTVVFGGVKINPQMMKLRGGVDILVATPGRLLDLYQQKAVRFNELEFLVLDEADRMLDMGFLRDIKKIISLLPRKRQTLMFSATFSEEIRTLAKTLVKSPKEISVSVRNSTVETVKQWLCPVDKKSKAQVLIKLIKDNNWQQALVFTRTKRGANALSRKLNDAGITSAPIHGNKSQNARTKALAEFKDEKTKILVATDIAARGLDIDQLPQVVNFDLPHVAEDYVHRIGRTGRAGATGQAVSLVTADDLKELIGIERLTQQVIERKNIKGFEPVNEVPVTTLDSRPIHAPRPKKPNKPRSSNGNSVSGQSRSNGNKSNPRRRSSKPSTKKN